MWALCSNIKPWFLTENGRSRLERLCLDLTDGADLSLYLRGFESEEGLSGPDVLSNWGRALRHSVEGQLTQSECLPEWFMVPFSHKEASEAPICCFCGNSYTPPASRHPKSFARP